MGLLRLVLLIASAAVALQTIDAKYLGEVSGSQNQTLCAPRIPKRYMHHKSDRSYVLPESCYGTGAQSDGVLSYE